MRFKIRFLLICFILFLVVGSSVQAGKWSRAFNRAVKDPDTWVPAAAAAVIAVGGVDQEISDWATRRTPLFGSQEAALQASETLRTASDFGMAATSLFLSRESGYRRNFQGQTLHTSIGYVGAITATSTTGLLKSVTFRHRPDGSNRRSFPSSHTSRAFAYAAFGHRALRESSLPRSARVGLRWGLTGLAAGTGWARVEAGVHYPTDVLIGASLGNLAGKFMSELILGPESDLSLSIDLNPDQPQVNISWRF